MNAIRDQRDAPPRGWYEATAKERACVESLLRHMRMRRESVTSEKIEVNFDRTGEVSGLLTQVYERFLAQ